MAKWAFGVDIGGTSIKLGLFDSQGNMLDKWEIPTVLEGGGSRILPDTAASILAKIEERGLDKAQIGGVGVGVPGPVDRDGVALMAVNLGWERVDVPKILGEALGLPVRAGNDCNMAACGERWKGGGQGYKDLVAITLGTGVGGGIILNGEMVSGRAGGAGEIGHFHIEDDEDTDCNCGCRGCVEQYASATGIVRLAGKYLEAHPQEESLLRGKEYTAKDIFEAAKAGDAAALHTVHRFGDYLGKALATVASILDPEIFIIGGGVSKAGEVIFDYLRPAFERHTFSGVRGAKMVLAALGNDAGMYGAASLFLIEK